jgi:hypothetical protein
MPSLAYDRKARLKMQRHDAADKLCADFVAPDASPQFIFSGCRANPDIDWFRAPTILQLRLRPTDFDIAPPAATFSAAVCSPQRRYVETSHRRPWAHCRQQSGTIAGRFLAPRRMDSAPSAFSVRRENLL